MIKFGAYANRFKMGISPFSLAMVRHFQTINQFLIGIAKCVCVYNLSILCKAN